jgi:hypothetical protein
MMRPKRIGSTQCWRRVCFSLFFLILSAHGFAGRTGKDTWELLAVGYPVDRDISVVLGGSERTLAAKGLCKVEWQNNVATLELEVENLAAPPQLGWTGQQYVLWAVDAEKRTLNLGPLPVNDNEAKWTGQAPFRIFGLLVTAEADAKATTPSNSVALESRLPTNPTLIVPVFRVNLSLGGSGR